MVRHDLRDVSPRCLTVLLSCYGTLLAAAAGGEHAATQPSLTKRSPPGGAGRHALDDTLALIQADVGRERAGLSAGAASSHTSGVGVGHTSIRHDSTGYIVFACFAALVAGNWALKRGKAGTPEGKARERQAESPEAQHEAQGTRSSQVVTASWVIMWMGLSAIFVIFNKWLFTHGGFPHPLLLATFHMASCFLTFGLFRLLAPARWKEQLMPDADVKISWRTYMREVMPVALFYTVTLGAGNLAFLYSSVAFLQMIKPLNIVFTSFAAFALMVEPPTIAHVTIVFIVAGGVSLAATGDVEFSIVGLVLQLTASSSEGLRLALLQKLMTKEIQLDPVTTIMHFAPVAGLALSVACIILDSPVKWHALQSPVSLVGNLVLAVILNILIVTVIRKTSAVIFTMCGVLKDIGAIAFSMFLFRTPIHWKEVLGYIVAIFGIVLYKFYKDSLKALKSASPPEIRAPAEKAAAPAKKA